MSMRCCVAVVQVVRSLLAFARVVEGRPGYSGPSIAEELAAAGSAYVP